MSIAVLETPDEIGMWDARQGYAFAPESYYARRNDKALYALGFLSVQPDNVAALAYMRSVEEQHGEDHENMVAEANYTRYGIGYRRAR